MEPKEILIEWLKNAYAMEQQIVQTLEAHAKDFDSMPEMQEMIEQHIEETKDQADRVKMEVERLGDEVSSVKSGLAEAMGMMTGMGSDLFKDKIVKNAIAEHATEHLEMATYEAIATAAEIADEPATRELAMDLVKEETRTGEKLKTMLPQVVRKYFENRAE
ncbi:MAG: DUF892 family protein [Patescibacteria group bacterium]